MIVSRSAGRLVTGARYLLLTGITAGLLSACNPGQVRRIDAAQSLNAYADRVALRLQDHLEDSRSGTRVAEPGCAVLKLHISRDGLIAGASVVLSSGHVDVDREALAAAYRISPLPPVPDELSRGGRFVDIEIPALLANWPAGPATPATPAVAAVRTLTAKATQAGAASAQNAYFVSVQRQILQALHYPPSTALARERGATEVRFAITRDGAVEDVDILQSSGVAMLDVETLEVFRRIGRFPPPAALPPGVDRLVFELPIDYAPET